MRRTAGANADSFASLRNDKQQWWNDKQENHELQQRRGDAKSGWIDAEGRAILKATRHFEAFLIPSVSY
jgi:hypothetical protein